MPKHTVYTKKALRPIPGARPKGSLPKKAIAMVPTIAAKAVEVNTAPAGIPSSSLNMAGFDGQDVRHGQECRDAREHYGANGRFFGIKPRNVFQHNDDK